MSPTLASGPLGFVQALLGKVGLRDQRIAGQGLRFALAGALVMLVNVVVTTLLHDLAGLPFQLALIVGFTVSVALHFTLQRQFVWKQSEAFALGLRHQALRYLFVCALQYAAAALSTSQLPGPLGLPVELVYVLTVSIVPLVNFIVFRGRVFHTGPAREATVSGEI